MSEKTTSPALSEPVLSSVKPIDLAAMSNFDTAVVVYWRRRLLNILVIGIGDILALNIGLIIAGLLRWWLKGQTMIPEWSWAIITGWILGALVLGLLPGWGLGAVEELRRTIWLAAGLFALVALGLFLGKIGTEISRLTLTTTILISAPLILLLRNGTRQFLLERGRWGLPTVVYGGSDTGRLAIRALQEQASLGFIPVGIFEDQIAGGEETIEGVPILGGIKESTSAAPAAVLAMNDIPRHELVGLLDGPLSSYRQVVIVPDLIEAPSLWVRPRDLGGILGLEVSHNLLDPVARFTKRAADLALVLALSVVWVPVCGVVALMIWLEDRRSPVFFQERTGKNNEIFRMYKFRTMVPDAEEALRQAIEEDEALREEWESSFKLRKDPRVTRIGAFLRKASLDELPQLYNVLMGHMSLVGPRPLPMYHYDQLPPRLHRLRERVRPGITGLWQVSGRSDTGNEGLLRWDSYYVRNWSIWLDIVILIRTFNAVIRRDGAY
jgi:Undecaprenyl-phosphate galactose phosphotransferase WbaP